ncbi:hypothetical protein BaRGS_00008931, partial [Batillaria attramentaria]
VSCGSPPPVRHAEASVASGVFTDIVTYRCANGYQNNNTDGTGRRYCSADGTWVQDKADPLCVETLCGVPPRINNTDLYPKQVGGSVNDTASYACKEGFVQSQGGSGTRTCTVSGEWAANDTDPDPVCQDKDECMSGLNDCSQECVNLEGSYACRCYDGYVHLANGSGCRDHPLPRRNAGVWLDGETPLALLSQKNPRKVMMMREAMQRSIAKSLAELDIRDTGSDPDILELRRRASQVSGDPGLTCEDDVSTHGMGSSIDRLDAYTDDEGLLWYHAFGEEEYERLRSIVMASQDVAGPSKTAYQGAKLRPAENAGILSFQGGSFRPTDKTLDMAKPAEASHRRKASMECMSPRGSMGWRDSSVHFDPVTFARQAFYFNRDDAAVSSADSSPPVTTRATDPARVIARPTVVITRPGEDLDTQGTKGNNTKNRKTRDNA